MVVYVSPAEMNGGILQFSTSIARETGAMTDCRLFLPDVVDKSLYQDIADKVVPYVKAKTLQGNSKEILSVARQIMSFSPDIVIFVEDSILMQQLNRVLNKNNVKTAMVVHDVQHHPYRKMGLRRVLVDVLRRRMMRNTIKHIDKIILLSVNSEEAFRREYKAENTVVFRLPAHVPTVLPQKPSEIENGEKDFLLFFGRIDKYKGVNTLCHAYSALPEDYKAETGLVIAGNGQLSEEESQLIQSERCITPIIRFISDEEMVWLFQNAHGVVLPYTEASQSGVLPIAYKFGKLVIVSDLRGLTENVVEKNTGYVFRTTDELSELLLLVKQSDAGAMKLYIEKYFEENFSWKKNIKKLFGLIGVEVEWCSHSADIEC